MKKLLILFCLSLSLVQGQDSLMFDYAYRATAKEDFCQYKGISRKISDTVYAVNGKANKSDKTFSAYYRDSTLLIKHGKFIEEDSNYVWHSYYENGFKNGVSKKYTIDQKLLSIRKFEKGVHVGVDSFFNVKGKLELTSDLNYQTYNGTFCQFNDEGKIIKKCKIKYGLFVCSECACDSINNGNVFWHRVPKYNGVVEEAVQKNFHPSYSKMKPGKYEVWVQFKVSISGYVEEVEIGKSSGSKIVDNEAINAVLKLKRFRPAVQNGLPVVMPMQIPIVFIVE
jgi:TonB family protein